MKFPLRITTRSVTIGASIFLIGTVCGIVIPYSIYQERLEASNAATTSLLALTDSQSRLISQFSSEQAASLERPPVMLAPNVSQPPAPSTQTSTTLSVVTTGVTAPLSAPTKAVVTPPVAVKQLPSRMAARTVVEPRQVLKGAPPTTPAATGSVMATASGSGSNGVKASNSASEQGTPAAVTLEEAGIAAIDTASVRFRSGRQVLLGGDFPSGEKLLSINPAEGRIVTDRRTIILAKPPVTP